MSRKASSWTEAPSLDWAVDESLQFILFALVAGALLLGLAAMICLRRAPRRTSPPRPAGPPHLTLVPANPPPAARLAPEAAAQLRQVMAAPFRARPLLSRPEAQFLRTLEAAIAERGLPWRVMAQVPLGEILASPSAQAYAAITFKRVDLLLIDAASRPIAAIACQGARRLGGATACDPVKKAALGRAGIRWIELTRAQRPQDLVREIDRLATAMGLARGRRLSVAPAAPANE